MKPKKSERLIASRYISVLRSNPQKYAKPSRSEQMRRQRHQMSDLRMAKRIELENVLWGRTETAQEYIRADSHSWLLSVPIEYVFLL